MLVCPGDWIITGVQGERYPCKPGIFDATYEPADGPPLVEHFATLIEFLWTERHQKVQAHPNGVHVADLPGQTSVWLDTALVLAREVRDRVDS